MNSVKILHAVRSAITATAELLVSNLISGLYCYSHVSERRCIRPYHDSKTASIQYHTVHSNRDYGTSFYYSLPSLPKFSVTRPQQCQNSPAMLPCSAVFKTPKLTHTIPIL